MTPVKLLLVVPPVRKAEEGSAQPVRVGDGVHQGGASSKRWKGRVLPSATGKDPSRIWLTPVASPAKGKSELLPSSVSVREIR